MARASSALVLALVALAPAGALAAGLPDHLVQPPTLAAPAPGSVAGTPAAFGFAPGALARGAYALALPVELPAGRGAPLVDVLPGYSPDAALSEWGMGWSTRLALTRAPVVGDVDLAVDAWTSPWGRLVTGDGQTFYPAGWATPLVVRRQAGGFEAEDGEGTRYRFAAADAVASGYAFLLSEVVALDGERTTLTWTRNASGRPFLDEVSYGGRAGVAQVRVRLVYEPLARGVDSYLSGTRLVLDRRVQEIDVDVRAGGSGDFERLVAYRLGYDAAALGPAFYLSSLTAVHRSGAAEPTVRYEYDTGLGALTGARLGDADGFESVVAARGSAALSPARATWVDLEDDGRPELELASDQAIAARGASGWTITPTPEPAGAVTLCRPHLGADNPARVLARLTPDAAAPEVVRTLPGDSAATTRVVVCTREGRLVDDLTVRGGYVLGPTTHLVDVDRDLRPDLVRVDAGGVYVLHNESGPDGHAFVPWPVAPLPLAQTPEASWLHDMNGDGLADVVVRLPGGLAVYAGTGHGHFVAKARSIVFYAASGTALADVRGRSLTFLDVNRDGLADVLSGKDGQLGLFVNDGADLRAVRVPGLEGTSAALALPVVVDLHQSGEVEVAILAAGQLRTLRLTHAGTGLLRAFHDGRGIDVDLGYARGPGGPGAPVAPVVLSAVAMHVAGLAPLTVTYDYAGPVVHRAGRFLVGYRQVGKTTPLEREAVELHHDDELSDILVERVVTDLRRGLVRFTRHEHDEIVTHGVVRTFRARLTRSGWRRGDGSEVARVTEVLAWERDVCPTRIEERGPAGRLERTATLAHVASLADDLHCLAHDETLRGRHADAALDFDHAVTTERDGTGAPTRLVQHGPDGDLVRQIIGHDAWHRPTTIEVPGLGVTQVSYDPATGLVSQIIAPDGSSRQIADIDGVADLVRALRLDRGGASVVESFRFDARERLATRWDDAGATAEATPAESFGYVDVSAGAPGLVARETLVDPASGASVHAADAVAGDGAALASLRRIPEGWQVLALSLEDRAQGSSRRYRGVTLAPGALGGRDFASYFAGAAVVASATTDASGAPLEAHAVVEAGVDDAQVTTTQLEGDLLVETTVENGATRTRRALDVDGAVVWSEDEAGHRLTRTTDALGRLAGLVLPDGTRHTRRYDGYGRPRELVRDGVGTLRYQYDPATGLLVGEDVLGADGQLERHVQLVRDRLGRVERTIHTQPRSGRARVFVTHHDGVHEDGSVDPGQLGQATQVRGDGFVRTMHVDRRGRLAWVRLVLDGFRTVEQRFTTYEDGSPDTTTWIVYDAAGVELFRTTQKSLVDADGRLAALDVDGARLATLAYDGEGRVERVDLASGGTIAQEFDPVTGADRATWQDATTWNARWETRRNARGQVEHELVTFGDATQDRVYGYDARGLLTSVAGDAAPASYEYDDTGRPTKTTDGAGERGLWRVGPFVVAGGHVYRYDALGRVVARDGAELTWGPSGEIDTVRAGDTEVRYLYDESGERILATTEGGRREARVGGAVLDDDRLLLPLRIAGRLSGVLDVSALGTRFELVGVDPRGTPFVDGDAFAPATPYGVRARRPELARALDFAEHGYDAALGTVRFGRRDYDPLLGRFVSPDPLLLEDLDACAGRPRECNLESYAAGDPLGHVDPGGTEAFELAPSAFYRQPGVPDLGGPIVNVMAPLPGLPGAMPLTLVALPVPTAPPQVDRVRLRGVPIGADARTVLAGILSDAGLKSVTVTSYNRTAHDQARIMYGNIVKKGMASQYRLYAAAGDAVIDVYKANKKLSRDEVVEKMEAKITELGASKVSKHCSDAYDVIDLSPASIADRPAFDRELKAAIEGGKVAKAIAPGDDPAYHLEILKKPAAP